MSRAGLALGALYGAPMLACLLLAWSAGGDPKGQFVFLQLGLLPQLTVIHAVGLDRPLHGLPWSAAYALFGLPMPALLYASGAQLARLRTYRSAPRDVH